VEFVAACTRKSAGGLLLSPADACREAEDLLAMFETFYPNEALVRPRPHHGKHTYERSKPNGGSLHPSRSPRPLSL
jgi:hypothetical protein